MISQSPEIFCVTQKYLFKWSCHCLLWGQWLQPPCACAPSLIVTMSVRFLFYVRHSFLLQEQPESVNVIHLVLYMKASTASCTEFTSCQGRRLVILSCLLNPFSWVIPWQITWPLMPKASYDISTKLLFSIVKSLLSSETELCHVAEFIPCMTSYFSAFSQFIHIIH